MGRRILFVTAITSFLSSQDAQAALVAHWDFDGNLSQSVSGGPSFVSSSGASFTSGIVGDAVSLTGGTSVLDLGANTVGFLSTANDLTVAMWVKASVAQKQSLISFDDDTGWFYRTALYTDENGIRAAYTNGANQTTVIGVDTTYENEWVHLALTQDINNGSGQTELSLYINGQFVTSGTVVTNASGTLIDSGSVGRYHIQPGQSSLDPLQSSGALVGQGSNYAGLIDALSIWNTQLSASEISALHAVATPEPSSLSMIALGVLLFARRSRSNRNRVPPA